MLNLSQSNIENNPYLVNDLELKNNYNSLRADFTSFQIIQDGINATWQTTSNDEKPATTTSTSKIEDYGDTNYDNNANVIAHTFDEKNLFIEVLDDNYLMQLNLMIDNVTNNINYKQVIVINCEAHKSYVNTLTINSVATEIKYRDGDININLAPIANYSVIIQTFDITRINNNWYVMSNIDLFYNSLTNIPSDIIPPNITLNGAAVINHEINSSIYVDAGATANDNIDALSNNSIVVSGDADVDHTKLGVYNINYNLTDNSGNSATQVTRVVVVADVTSPIITLIGLAEITIDQNTIWSEPGASVSDNSNENLNITYGGDTINTSVLGDYTF